MTTLAPLPPAAGDSALLGVLPELARDSLGLFERLRREHGDVVRFVAGPPKLRTTMYAVFHPDGVHHVLAGRADEYRKDNRFYGEIRWAVGDGVLNSQDERWKRQRRFVQPLFTRKRIAGYAATMGEEAESVAARWADAARTGEPVDAHAEMSRLTLRVVGRVLFGDDVERALPVVRGAIPVLGEYARRRAYNPASPPRTWPTPANRRALRTRAAVYGVCDELIAARRAAGSGGHDLIGRLVSARDDGEALGDEEIRDQALVFLLAGHDTTSIALTFSLHLLGRHPAARARVQEEVDAVLDGRTPGEEEVERLPYTTMVLKEAMRLFPPAWATGRRTASGDEIGGFRVPPGADVVVSPWVTHRHPEFWDEPERFDPERFTPAREAARHRHAYFPFGAGPRACIGQYFAMLEGVIALAVLLRDYDVESLTERLPLAPRITLHPAAPVLCRLRARRPVDGPTQPAPATRVAAPPAA
jgi:cytochrome P450